MTADREAELLRQIAMLHSTAAITAFRDALRHCGEPLTSKLYAALITQSGVVRGAENGA